VPDDASGTGGGRATVGGTSFQVRVGAWLLGRILLEQNATSLHRLPADVIAGKLFSETRGATDDLVVEWQNGGFSFMQAKQGLSAEIAPSSDFAKTIRQFVNQHHECRNRAAGPRPWNRPLDPVRDRLVLVVDEGASGPVSRLLPKVLDRARGDAARPLSDVAETQGERDVWTKFIGHLKREWGEVHGAAPADADLRELIAFLVVQSVPDDLETWAEGELRPQLRIPAESRSARAVLIAAATEAARDGLTLDRSQVVDRLEAAGIYLKTRRSFEADVDALRAQTEGVLSELSRDMSLPGPLGAIRVRRGVTTALRSLADAGHCVVTGAPGIGKSGVLCAAVTEWRGDSRDVAVVSVARLESGSDGNLRNELGLTHPFVEVLREWVGVGRGLLVLDGLDAARSSEQDGFFRALMRSAMERAPRWVIVASVRRYALEQGVELRGLFRSPSGTGGRSGALLEGVRHIEVPLLTDAELEQVFASHEPLRAVMAVAPQEVVEFLRVPFNLRLLAELIADGVTPQAVDLATRTALLTKYWHHRVEGPDLSERHARLTVLKRAAEVMLRTGVLRVGRDQFAAESAALEALLSNGVMRPVVASHGGPSTAVMFAHDLLFDFAVQHLLFEGEQPQVLAAQLAASAAPSFLVVRPALQLHFEANWDRGDASRRGFWQLTFAFAANASLATMSKLVGVGVAVSRARTFDDVKVLTEALRPGADERSSALATLRLLIGASGAVDNPRTAFAGPLAGPWIALMREVARHPSGDVAGLLNPWFLRAWECAAELTAAQRVDAGFAARSVLGAVLADSFGPGRAHPQATRVVMRTWDTDAAACADLLRQMLRPQRLALVGHQDLFWVVQEIERLFALESDLVVDVYAACFAHEISSDEQITMGPGRVLPLTTSRRDAFENVRWQLGQVFPRLLEANPRAAMSILERLMETWQERRWPNTTSLPPLSFAFRGRTIRLERDGSNMWDRSMGTHELPFQMLEAFESQLTTLAESDGEAQLDALLDAVAERCTRAIIWRRLIRAGWANKALGMKLIALFETELVVAQEATAGLVRMFDSLKEDLPVEQRTAIAERIPGQSGGPGAGAPTKESLRRQSRGAEDDEDEGSSIVTYGAPWETPRRQGESDPVFQQVSAFIHEHVQREVPPQAVAAVLPSLQVLQRRIGSRLARRLARVVQWVWSRIAALLRVRARLSGPATSRDWGLLAEAAAIAARSTDLGRATGFLRETMLDASEHPLPALQEGAGERFAEMQAWNVGSPRLHAAQGIAALIAGALPNDQDLRAAAVRLARDPVPEVRYQLAENAELLQRVPEIRSKMLQSETNGGVLQALLNWGMVGLPNAEVSRFAGVLIDRIPVERGTEEVRRRCWERIGDIYLRTGDADGLRRLSELAQNPSRDGVGMRAVIRLWREALVVADSPDAGHRQTIRRRALAVIDVAVERANAVVRDEQANEQTREASGRLLYEVATQIYFGSGAHREGGRRRPPGIDEGPTEAERDFFLDGQRVLTALSTFGEPAAVNYFVQTLEHFIPIDPAGVFRLLASSIAAGVPYGLHTEELVLAEVVRIVERYLADYRHVLDHPAALAELNAILEAFVSAGWPEAHRLVMRLPAAFA
jgi:hypothetical protein